jgi:hypothetical protein
MDHRIESPPRIRCAGNFLGFLAVGQISYNDMRGVWHMLLRMTGAFGVARVEDNLVAFAG